MDFMARMQEELGQISSFLQLIYPKSPQNHVGDQEK